MSTAKSIMFVFGHNLPKSSRQCNVDKSSVLNSLTFQASKCRTSKPNFFKIKNSKFRSILKYSLEGVESQVILCTF